MLTPLDIETKKFKTNLGGYNREDVDEFMRLVLEDFKVVYMENIALKDKVGALSGAVQRYKAMEDVMQNTLIVAQSTSEELKHAASEKAGAILSEAEAKAASIILEAKQKASGIELQKKELEYEMETFKRKEAAAIRALLSILEDSSKEGGQEG